MRCVNSVNVVCAKDQNLFAFNINFGSAVLAIQNMVASLNRHGKVLAFVVDLAFAYSQNNTGLGLFLGLCSDVQATCGGFLSQFNSRLVASAVVTMV